MTPSHDTHREGKNLQMFEGMAGLESGHVRLGGLCLEIHNERFRDHEIAVEADAVWPQALARGDYRVWPVLFALSALSASTRVQGGRILAYAPRTTRSLHTSGMHVSILATLHARPHSQAHTRTTIDSQPDTHIDRQTDRQTRKRTGPSSA